MTKEEFKQIALRDIKLNPADRISQKVKNLLDKDDLVFESHCHIFDINCVPRLYFAIRKLGETAENIDQFEDAISLASLNSGIPDIPEFIEISKMDSMSSILSFYKNFYSYGPSTVYVPLMMDLEKGWEISWGTWLKLLFKRGLSGKAKKIGRGANTRN